MEGSLRVFLRVLCLAQLAHVAANSDCDRDFYSSRKKNGTFSSPYYPNPYPSGTCRYNFHGQGKERVQIVFTELDLNYPPGDPSEPYDCEGVDSVTVSIRIGGQSREIGIYCGSKSPPMLMSNGNQIEVTFTSYGTSRATGFRATYQFVTDFGIKSGVQNNDMVCGFSFKIEDAPNGTFTSPNFPGLYPRETECHYLFYGTHSTIKINVAFRYFDVEGISPGCFEDTQSDYVEFSNFNIDLPDRKMKRVCGTSEFAEPKSVLSDGYFFRVTFKSNDVYDATGFEAFYQFRKMEEPPPLRPASAKHLQPIVLQIFLLPIAAMKFL